MSNEKLVNKGVWIANPAPVEPQVTIAATGLGRSGTTMIARILHELGLYMGEKVSERTHEDKKILQTIKTKDIKRFQKICKQRNEEHDIWGFKCPALRGMLVKFTNRMRNPRLIVTYRDVLSISLRNNIALDAEIVSTMKTAAKGYSYLINAVEAANVPTLMISYEKALQFPENTVEEIAKFCGLPMDEATKARAVAVIQNGDPRYLGNTEEALDNDQDDDGTGALPDLPELPEPPTVLTNA